MMSVFRRAGHVNRDDDRPFQALGRMNGYERDGLLLGVRSSLHQASRLFPIGAHVAGEGAEATNVIGARHLEENVRVGEHAARIRNLVPHTKLEQNL